MSVKAKTKTNKPKTANNKLANKTFNVSFKLSVPPGLKRPTMTELRSVLQQFNSKLGIGQFRVEAVTEPAEKKAESSNSDLSLELDLAG